MVISRKNLKNTLEFLISFREYLDNDKKLCVDDELRSAINKVESALESKLKRKPGRDWNEFYNSLFSLVYTPDRRYLFMARYK